MGHARQDAGSPAELYSDDILHAMVQAAPVAIVVADDRGGIVLVNNKLADMFGYDGDALVGEPIEMLMPERYRGGHVGYREEYAGNPRQRPMGSGLDLAGRRRDGSEFPIEVGLSHYRSGERSWVMATVADITRRKQNEEFLERRVQERTREIERRRQVSDTLREILAILNSDRPLAEILQHIVVQASLLLQADASAIYQVQDAEPAVIIQASCGLSRQQLDNPFNLTLPAAVNQAAGKGELISIAAGPDAGAAANSPFGDEASDSSNTYCAQLAVPLRIKDETYGGLMLYYLEPRKFSDEEIELAVMFGDQAVLAIENAGLRARAERTAIAAERNRIARDLHDSVTQTLFSATLIAEVLPKLVERNGSEGMRRLEELRQLTRGALAEMRTLLLELRPATLIEVSIEELLRQLTEAARGRARIPIDLQVQVTEPLPPDAKVAFYYIAQEALNNVAKHARAGSAYVTLTSHAAGAVLSIIDDGQGFDVTQVTPEHLGLAIMRERSESIDGELAIDSTPGEGTEVTIRWTNPETAGAV
jgi:PAS domain S-box-containing protein